MPFTSLGSTGGKLHREELKLEYLFNEYMDRQVILFTCKEREAETAVNVAGGRLNVVAI